LKLAKLPIELLMQFVQYCNSLVNSTVIVVEGKRDIEALSVLGIHLSQNSIIARRGMSTEELVDRIISKKSIVLLLDFDREGKHQRKVIRNSIQRRKGHGSIDPFPRQLLFKFCSAARISEIEELKQFSHLLPKE
jgi:5S rRNA maturation endonuclease (ribonuclease M5)